MKTFLILTMLATTGAYAGEKIEMLDDKVNPVETQKVIITDTEIKEVVEKTFEGSKNDLISTIGLFTKQRDALNIQIANYQAIQQKIDIELAKLPPRKP